MVWLIVLFVISSIIGTLNFGVVQCAIWSSVNISVIAMMLVAIAIYIKIKGCAFKNILDQYIGLGDILFFVAIASLMTLREYVWLQIISFIVALIWWVFNRQKTIPLVGVISIILTLKQLLIWI